MENLTYIVTDIGAANAPNMDLVEGDVRPLGSLEHLFWLLDQGSPMHFSLAAQIAGARNCRGLADNPRPRTATSPIFLCVHREQRARQSAVSSGGASGADYDSSCAGRASQPNWLTEMQRELATPFGPERAPLVRAVLMHDPRELLSS
jgi:hypothetical protein